jgi:hypothetical protein
VRIAVGIMLMIAGFLSFGSPNYLALNIAHASQEGIWFLLITVLSVLLVALIVGGGIRTLRRRAWR